MSLLLLLLSITKIPAPLRAVDFLPQKRNHTPRILGRERRTPRNNYITPGISSALNRTRSDPSIYFDIKVGVSGAQIKDFGEAGCYALLASETRFDCLTRPLARTEGGGEGMMGGDEPLREPCRFGRSRGRGLRRGFWV